MDERNKIEEIKKIFTRKDGSEFVMRVVRMPNISEEWYTDSEKAYTIHEDVINPEMEKFDDYLNYIEGVRKLKQGFVIEVEVLPSGARYDGHYVPVKEKRDLIPYEECSPEQKKKIEEKRNRLKGIIESEDKEYDKPGKIYFRYKGEKIEVDVTQRQLAKAGFESMDVRWESLEKIEERERKEQEKMRIQTEDNGEVKKAPSTRETPKEENIKKEIVEVATKKGLTKTEVGGIRGFFQRIWNKFRGKGEI